MLTDAQTIEMLLAVRDRMRELGHEDFDPFGIAPTGDDEDEEEG